MKSAVVALVFLSSAAQANAVTAGQFMTRLLSDKSVVRLSDCSLAINGNGVEGDVFEGTSQNLGVTVNFDSAAVFSWADSKHTLMNVHMSAVRNGLGESMEVKVRVAGGKMKFVGLTTVTRSKMFGMIPASEENSCFEETDGMGSSVRRSSHNSSLGN